MDWARAKTLLIVVFVVVNVFLIQRIIAIDARQINGKDSINVRDAIHYLRQHNVNIQGDIPEKNADVPALAVIQKQFTVEGIKNKLLNDGSTVESGLNGDKWTIKNNNITITIDKRGQLAYRTFDYDAYTIDGNETHCQKVIDKFLADAGISMKDAYVVKKSFAKGQLTISYGQAFQTIPIENSHMRIIASSKAVLSADILWLDSIKPGSKEGLPIPPTDLLVYMAPLGTKQEDYSTLRKSNGRLYKLEEVSGNETLNNFLTIEEMTQKFYWDVSKSKSGQGLEATVTAVPVWALKTEKAIFYINSINGKLLNEGI